MRRSRIHERRERAFLDTDLMAVLAEDVHKIGRGVSDLCLMFESSQDAEQLGPLYAVYSGMMHHVQGNCCYLKE